MTYRPVALRERPSRAEQNPVMRRPSATAVALAAHRLHLAGQAIADVRDGVAARQRTWIARVPVLRREEGGVPAVGGECDVEDALAEGRRARAALLGDVAAVEAAGRELARRLRWRRLRDAHAADDRVARAIGIGGDEVGRARGQPDRHAVLRE